MVSRIQQLRAEEALNRIGAIIYYEHEWDMPRDCSSRRPMPGPIWGQRFLGESFFAKPCGCIIYDYTGSMDYLHWLTFLPSLREVAIIQSAVGDELCEYLRTLRNLRNISLHGTSITDAGIARLVVLQNLETLIVGETAVTPDGRKVLTDRLPNCKVVDSVPVMLPAA